MGKNGSWRSMEGRGGKRRPEGTHEAKEVAESCLNESDLLFHGTRGPNVSDKKRQMSMFRIRGSFKGRRDEEREAD
jgi:hypothetical protein